jgi:hypothetical protein
MTLLNIANDGYYNVLVAIFRALIVEGTMDQLKMIKLCSDGSKEADERLKDTINRWVQLGLFNLNEGNLALAPEVKKRLGNRKSLDAATHSLPGIIRRIIFSEENNARFWDKEKARSADLSRGLSWMLAQDVYSFPFGPYNAVKELESHQVSDEKLRILGNDVSYNGLRTWANFLGFLWQSKSLMIDPTAAIRQDLPLIFGRKKELSAEQFANQASIVLPVLDGGKYREMVESKLDVSHWAKPDRSDVLSMSFSRAIFRLESSGDLKLIDRSDTASGRSLLKMGGDIGNNFTHIIWQGSPR